MIDQINVDYYYVLNNVDRSSFVFLMLINLIEKNVVSL